MADPAIVINCGPAGGTTVTDTASIAAAVTAFDTANAQANADALADYVEASNPANSTDMPPADLTDPGDGVIDGSGD